ncbi:cytoskeletal protein binding protein [Pleurotus pulmonarius]|nr:cytoskeletal protein binding protein [Pleurotus pulmonarius]KAF4600703.1 cytoskeletal protein binding protein [Pleurotus pulmonarius]
MPFDEYLAVLKASYDYVPQTDEDEIAIKENQILFLIEKVDDDWWKVKIKGSTQDEDSPVGLVPAAYVEPADHISTVKALYDYDAAANGELSMKEDEILDVYASEEEWLLVQSKSSGGKAGYVPGNYVEAISDDEGSASSVPAPPTNSRPISTYVDPADRVASAKVTADDIKTWAVSEIDKKGKKKKGTLGIGNGAVFFASEADKTPVQQWKTSDINTATIEKSKHILVDIGGPNPINLHFHVGSKDNAEAILAKLESSKQLHSGARPTSPEAEAAESEAQDDSEASRPSALRSEPKPKKNGASVHFSPASPAIIPPRDSTDDEAEEEEPAPSYTTNGRHDPPPARSTGGDDSATVLYDFDADGEDELSVKEGEQLVVLEKDGNDWWKCRNAQGKVGVVPASYLESESGPSAAAADDTEDDEANLRAEQEANEREEAQRLEKERLQKEKERKERVEKEKAERERAERDRKKAEAQLQAKAAADAAEKERRKRKEAAAARAASPPSEPRSSRSESTRDSPPSTPNRSSSERTTFPPADKTRVWHDRTGQFRVEAAFLGFSNGKLRLHKINGVIVEVPAEKMSPDDLRYVEKSMKRSKSTGARVSEDDIPLAMQRPNGSSSSSRQVPPQGPKKPRIDWFDFFLAAGCDVDDCTRYAAAFDKDKIDEAILPDITEGTMRSLGLREGDIIRVKKAIEKRIPSKTIGTPLDQVRSDEELARRLQAEESSGTSKSPPNLFAAGPGGALKATRRGRPQASKTLPQTVDLNTIATVSDQIQRTSSPQMLSPASLTPSSIQPPPRSSSALATKSSGFDDDAWTNRPSSTKPIAPTPPIAAPARAPSAPPPQAAAPAPPAAPPAPPAPAPPAPAAVSAPASSGSPGSLAKTTEADIFDQLARLSELRKQSQPVASPPPPPPPAPLAPQHTMVRPGPSPSPLAFSSQLGQTPQVGQPSFLGQPPQQGQPSPLGLPSLNPVFQQQTGFLQATPSPGPRGPLAPVPANQSLLQPLIPTQTGFGGFVPARPNNNPSPFQPQQQPSFLNSQPTSFGNPQPPSFLNTQPTGFQVNTQPPSFVNTQPTGFQVNAQQPSFSNPQPPSFVNTQATGFPGSIRPQATGIAGFGQQMQGSPFQNNSFGQLQPNPTGFNPGFGQIQQSPPPLPNSNANNNTSPANVFAQMKSGTFATESDSNAQNADRYNALRTNPIAVQPTGWGGSQGNYTGFRQ